MGNGWHEWIFGGGRVLHGKKKTGGRWGGFRGSGKDGSCVGIVGEEMDGRVGEMGKSGSRGIGMGGGGGT